ncbi:MAG: tetratricopeptide repeat protein [Labilithrix sp.]|nr:tetratricopeptide repeat protein [Labilithrix sp.]
MLAVVACGGGKQAAGPAAAAKGLPPANPVAVQRMVEGVTAAKDPRMQTRAIALLREAIAIDPNLWEARFDLGVVLANGGDLARAEQELAAAAKIAPEREEVAVALAEVRRRRGSQKEAAAALEAFVKEHPTALEARTLLVAALRDSGQHDKAIAEARNVLARKPGDATALAELALCHLGKGERETANLLVRQSLDVNAASPPSPARVLSYAVAHRAQGLVALAEGDDASAFKAFSLAAQEDPKDTTSRLNMGAVLLRAGSYAKAAEQFKSALAASPEETAAQLGLAAALRGESNGKDQKLLEEARTLLAQVLEREPHNVAALFNMGILLADSLKRPADAKPFFDRFLDDAPKDHPARPEAEKQLGNRSAAAPPVAPAPPAPPAPSTPTKPAPTPKQGVKK